MSLNTLQGPPEFWNWRKRRVLRTTYTKLVSNEAACETKIESERNKEKKNPGPDQNGIRTENFVQAGTRTETQARSRPEPERKPRTTKKKRKICFVRGGH